ncbi:MAG: CbiX/SirB N-terminal domain-containing protein [Phycisphaerae bacterium]
MQTARLNAGVTSPYGRMGSRRRALILAAHGSYARPETNRRTRAQADRLADRWKRSRLFDEVVVAFHQGEPAFDSVLDTITATDVTIVPLMTSQGYFSNVVLPRALARNVRYEDVALRITAPVGTHAAIASLAARRLRAILKTYALNGEETRLAVIGHGSLRHRGSRRATISLVEKLRRQGVCRDVSPAFLDESPRVDDVVAGSEQPNVVALPLLIGDGDHAVRDVPRRLGLRPSGRRSPPLAGRVDHRFVVCDAALGTDAGIIDVVACLATDACRGTL